jgi:hypothetical protein
MDLWNQSPFPSRGFRAACWLVVALSAAATLRAQERAGDPLAPIDDGKLRQQFQTTAETWIGEAAIPDGAAMLASLKARKDAPVWTLPPAEAPGPAPRLEPPEIYRRASAATLVLGHLYQCGKCSKWHPTLAGGVVIDPGGIAVTNSHVMRAAKAKVFGAMLPDGEAFPVTEILAVSEADDLAVVRLKVREGRKPLPTVRLAPANDPPGTGVHVVSHPDGRFFTFSEGMIARHFVTPDTKAARLHITADYARGSSGCGVFNPRGELTALVSATQSIYYTEEKGIQRNLQMVVKSTIPVSSLRRLLGAKAPEKK